MAALGPTLTRWVETGNVRDLVCAGSLCLAPGLIRAIVWLPGMSLPWIDVLPGGRKEALLVFPGRGKL